MRTFDDKVRILRAATLGLATLGMLLGCSGSGGSGSKAAPCIESSYPLGCVGDGRAAALTTSGNKPTSSCAKDDYVYFRLTLVMEVGGAAERSPIDHCTLQFEGDGWRQSYDLPAGTSAGTPYGCSTDQTPYIVGALSYSSCCSPLDTLRFRLLAYAADDSEIAMGFGSYNCPRPDGVRETPIVLTANPQ